MHACVFHVIRLYLITFSDAYVLGAGLQKVLAPETTPKEQLHACF